MKKILIVILFAIFLTGCSTLDKTFDILDIIFDDDSIQNTENQNTETQKDNKKTGGQ